MVIPFRLGPLTLLAGCQVTSVIDEPDRYGFVYATTAAHPEQGDELFLATRLADGGTRIDLVTRWRYRTLLARLGGPITSRVQRRGVEAILDTLAAPAGKDAASQRV